MTRTLTTLVRRASGWFRRGVETTYRRAFYFGFKFKCPFCHARLRRFLPFGLEVPVLEEKHVVGGGRRPNGLCPVCGTHDRHRLLLLYLRHKTDLFERRLRVLHVAPEPGVSRILQRRAELDYLTADLNPEDVMVRMDLTNIQYPDDSFDAIICNHVLEHIEDDRKAMRELYRVLKPGGWAVLQVPISLVLERTYEDFSITTPSGRERAFGQDDHVRIYARDYLQRLEQAGFAVAAFRWTDDPAGFGGAGNRYGLNVLEELYCVTKPRR